MGLHGLQDSSLCTDRCLNMSPINSTKHKQTGRPIDSPCLEGHVSSPFCRSQPFAAGAPHPDPAFPMSPSVPQPESFLQAGTKLSQATMCPRSLPGSPQLMLMHRKRVWAQLLPQAESSRPHLHASPGQQAGPAGVGARRPSDLTPFLLPSHLPFPGLHSASAP